MHRIILGLLCFMALLCSCVGGTGDPEEDAASWVRVGDRLPAFEVMMNDGRTVSDETLAGSVAVICFFNTGCNDCRRELPVLQRAFDEYGERATFVCISRSELAESVEKFWQEKGLTLPYSAQPDTRIYRCFAGHTIPRIYVADKQGTVKFIFVEKVSEKALHDALGSLVAD